MEVNDVLQSIILKRLREWFSKRVKMVVGFVGLCILAAAGISYFVQYYAR